MSLTLSASVADDGFPLPENPGSPDPEDPHKLRWKWSVVSLPLESSGVVWSGHPSQGEAFTYEGSALAPGTVFSCEPTATFDVPGRYVIEFSADDGAQKTNQQVMVLVKSTSEYRARGYAYLSPLPGSEHTPADTTIVLVRFSDLSPYDVTNLATFVTVTDPSSGPRAGQTRIASDGRTVLFQMAGGLTENKPVTVRLTPQTRTGAGGSVQPYEYQFMVSAPLPDGGLIDARGDNPPDQAKAKAFDNKAGTKWVDFIVPDGSAHFTWIQCLYPGEDTKVVNQYALTAADDAPECDPQSWRLYGVDMAGALALLDTQEGQVFESRGQRRAYSFSNFMAYRGYRLEITKVRDPASAAALQVAEVQFVEASGSIWWEYWTGITGGAVTDLTSHPNYPDQPTGRRALPRLESWAWNDNYGSRLRGYIVAPNTGDFLFWIACDDSGELWLSPDDQAPNKTLIAFNAAPVSPRAWKSYSSQQSPPIPLQAGRRYYFEALHKESIAHDQISVGWAKPGQNTALPSEIIPGSVLSPWEADSGSTPQAMPAAPAQEPAVSSSHTPAWGPLAQSRILPNGVSVPSDFPQAVITVNNQPSPGYIFLCNVGQAGIYYLLILDNDGSPVWYQRQSAWDFKVQRNGMITWSGASGFDRNFNYLRTFSAVNGYATDAHEFEMLEDGTYFMLGARAANVDLTRYNAGTSVFAQVFETLIQQFTPAGELVFQWRGWDHYDIRDVQGYDFNAGYITFPHMNALDFDADGHILVSAREVSEVTKINRHTGQIIWRLGGARSDFTFVNDPFNGFSYQHDISALGHNRYLLFDNGNFHTPQVSRAVEYELDLTHRTASLVWQFRDTPDKYANQMGSAQRLPNGNTLINFVLSGYPKVTEVDTNGVKQFEMSLSPGSELYRAFRFPWDGVVAKPLLILESYPDNVTLIFNKFGDHSVDHYRIYGGTSPAPTALVATSTTTLARLYSLVNGVRNYFRVTAVSTNGIESGYSNDESLIVNIIQPGANMVQNGDFALGTNGWIWAVAGSGAGSISGVTGACVVDLTAAGSALTDLQLRQTALKLLQGKQYVLEFDGSSVGGTHPIEVKLGQDQSPFATYYTATPTLAPARQHFRYSFTMASANDLNARLLFNLGGVNRDVVLDNVCVYMALETPVTISTVPGGLTFTVDGTNSTTSCNTYWVTNTSHALSTASPQFSGDGHTRYSFLAWSDGGERSHGVITPLWETNYTARFATQYLLDMVSSPPEGGTIIAEPAGPWHAADQRVTLTANPSPGFAFAAWEEVDAETGSTAEVTMKGYRQVVATFEVLVTVLIDTPSLVRRPDGRVQFNLTVSGDAATQATVWGATTLAPSDWQPLGTVPLTAGRGLFTDETAPAFPERRFYRVTLP